LFLTDFSKGFRYYGYSLKKNILMRFIDFFLHETYQVFCIPNLT